MKVFIVLFLIVILFNCGTPPQIIYEASSPERPGWIDQPPKGDEILYFVGICTGARSLEEGRETAAKDALKQIAHYIRSDIKSEFYEYLSTIEQKIMINIKNKSSATVQGATVVDSYYRKMTRIERNFILDKYNCYVLISFSKDQAIREIERQKKERKETVERAYQYYMEGITLETQRQYYQSYKFYQLAQDALKSVNEVVLIEKGEIQNSEQLLLLIQNRLQDLIKKIHSVSIKINSESSEKGIVRFKSSFRSTLTKEGFVVSTDPFFLIDGIVYLIPSGVVMNNFVYYAEGSVSAKRKDTNMVITTFPFKVKSFHRSMEKSVLNAFHMAGEEAGKGIVQMILEYEEDVTSNLKY